jgi:outer membrane protein assembly factor BamB
MKRSLHFATWLLLCLIIFFCYSCTTAIESDWLGPNRNGKYPASGLLSEWPEDGPVLLWKYDSLNWGHSSPAITGDAIYITGMPDSTSGYLYCLDLNGKLRWRDLYGAEFKSNYTGSRSAPVIAGNYLYLITGAGELICYDLPKKTKRWSIDFLEEFSDSLPTYGHAQSPLIVGNRIYCVPGGKEHNVVCLNRKSGKLIWSCKGASNNPSYSSPILVNHDGRKIVVAITQDEIMGIDARRGELLWTVTFHPFFVNHINTPVYHNGIVYMASEAGKGKGGIIAIQLHNRGSEAEVLWERKDIRNMLAGLMIHNNRLYSGMYRQKKWICLDPYTGQTISQWQDETYSGNITYADGHFYVLSYGGTVNLWAEADTGISIISRFKMDIELYYPFSPLWAYPVIKDKVLYIRHKGNLFAYDIGDKNR